MTAGEKGHSYRGEALSLASVEVPIQFNGWCGPHQPETHVASALFASGEALAAKHGHLVIEAVAIMLYLINAGFWNLFGWLEDLVSHVSLSPESEFVAPAPMPHKNGTKWLLSLLRHTHSGRLPVENKFKFKSSGLRPNCSASALIFSSSFISARPISSTC